MCTLGTKPWFDVKTVRPLNCKAISSSCTSMCVSYTHTSTALDLINRIIVNDEKLGAKRLGNMKTKIEVYTLRPSKTLKLSYIIYPPALRFKTEA